MLSLMKLSNCLIRNLVFETKHIQCQSLSTPEAFNRERVPRLGTYNAGSALLTHVHCLAGSIEWVPGSSVKYVHARWHGWMQAALMISCKYSIHHRQSIPRTGNALKHIMYRRS